MDRISRGLGSAGFVRQFGKLLGDTAESELAKQALEPRQGTAKSAIVPTPGEPAYRKLGLIDVDFPRMDVTAGGVPAPTPAPQCAPDQAIWQLTQVASPGRGNSEAQARHSRPEAVRAEFHRAVRFDEGPAGHRDSRNPVARRERDWSRIGNPLPGADRTPIRNREGSKKRAPESRVPVGPPRPRAPPWRRGCPARNSPGLRVGMRRCQYPWEAISCPASAMRRTSAGNRWATQPRVKNVPRAPKRAIRSSSIPVLRSTRLG